MCQGLFQNCSFYFQVNAIKSCWQSLLSTKELLILSTTLHLYLNVVELEGLCLKTPA